ncbi:MAG TPA: NAD(P)-binding domain-containing protein [Pyrinomonadaceae bacterium]|nr:NAD(P)-binding domain-containing protein [Pyrinomonadaceae bacterium]
MKIGIVGSGNIGATAARLFARAGHEVALSNSRGGAGLEALVGELGGKARAADIEGAARFGEVVLVAIPFGKYESLPAGAFEGKVVIDAGNYYPQRDGSFARLDSGETTSSELVAGTLGEGGRRQQVGTAVYNKELTAREAGEVLAAGRNAF